jgi:hypothetical protein
LLRSSAGRARPGGEGCRAARGVVGGSPKSTNCVRSPPGLRPNHEGSTNALRVRASSRHHRTRFSTRPFDLRIERLERPRRQPDCLRGPGSPPMAGILTRFLVGRSGFPCPPVGAWFLRRLPPGGLVSGQVEQDAGRRGVKGLRGIGVTLPTAAGRDPCGGGTRRCKGPSPTPEPGGSPPPGSLPTPGPRPRSSSTR